MACVHCEKIRAAILRGKIAEATGIAATAIKQAFGDGDTFEGFASGGTISSKDASRKTHIMGESGPEYIVPKKPEEPEDEQLDRD